MLYFNKTGGRCTLRKIIKMGNHDVGGGLLLWCRRQAEP